MNAFPLEDRRARAALEARYHVVVEERPPGPEHHFRLAMPRTYRPDETSQAPTGARPIATLGRYRDAAQAGRSIEVRGALVGRTIAPADWLEAELEARGLEVLERRRTARRGGAELDALTRAEGALSRWRATKTANRVFLVEARYELGAGREASLDALTAVATFTIKHPSRWPYAERLRTAAGAKPGDWCFAYPYSWECADIPSGDRGTTVIELTNPLGASGAGRVTWVCSASATGPRGLVDPWLAGLARRGLRATLGELSPAPAIGGLDAAWSARGSGTDERGRAMYDVHAYVGRRGSVLYLAGLAGYARQGALPVAAVNERSYEILLTSLRTERA